jgi:DNA-binding GntR family transcriptional regulator
MRQLYPDDPRPPYVQIVRAITADIAAGTLKPGQKLRSHQELATHYDVSVGTVKRALAELQGAGVVVSRQGQGAFIQSQPGGERALTEEVGELRSLLDEVSARLASVERRLAGS